jgi:hypothetical protein
MRSPLGNPPNNGRIGEAGNRRDCFADLGFGTTVARIVGATVRWRHATPHQRLVWRQLQSNGRADGDRRWRKSAPEQAVADFAETGTRQPRTNQDTASGCEMKKGKYAGKIGKFFRQDQENPLL